MSMQSWIVYLTLVLAATGTPGPAVLFIMTNSSLHGWRKAVFAALGNITGLLILGTVAITGLGAVIKTSEALFDVIKYAGAVYLVYLGFKMFFKKTSGLSDADERPALGTMPSRRLFLQALGVALSNPKAILFLTALLPQFVNLRRPLLPQFSVLMATLMLFSFSFLTAYALLADRIRGWLTRPARIKAFNRTSGSLFVGFGLLLAAARNR